jgi:hypothetical protein
LPLASALAYRSQIISGMRLLSRLPTNSAGLLRMVEFFASVSTILGATNSRTVVQEYAQSAGDTTIAL